MGKASRKKDTGKFATNFLMTEIMFGTLSTNLSGSHCDDSVSLPPCHVPPSASNGNQNSRVERNDSGSFEYVSQQTSKAKITIDEMNQVRSVLGEYGNLSWQVLSMDRDAGLALVHYLSYNDLARTTRRNAEELVVGDPSLRAWMRGVIVDYKRRVRVCSSFNYSPSVTSTSVYSDGVVRFKEDSGKWHEVRNYKIQYGYDGVILRIFKHLGKVYFATNRNIHGGQPGEHDVNQMSYRTMYLHLGGIPDDILFPAETLTSPYVYIFIMVHPNLAKTTRDEIGRGYLVYFGARKMWEPETCPFSGEELGLVESSPYNISTKSEIDPECRHIITPREMNLKEANIYLRGFKGFKDSKAEMDPRFSGAGFVMLYDRDAKEDEIQCYLFQSPAREWRKEITVEIVDNYTSRYVALLDAFNKPDFTDSDRERYRKMFPPLALMHDDYFPKLKENPRIYPEKAHTDVIPGSPASRNMHILLCLYYAVPLGYRNEVLDGRGKFLTMRRDLQRYFRTHLNIITDPNIDMKNLKKQKTISNIIYGARYLKAKSRTEEPKLRPANEVWPIIESELNRLSNTRMYQAAHFVERHGLLKNPYLLRYEKETQAEESAENVAAPMSRLNIRN